MQKSPDFTIFSKGNHIFPSRNNNFFFAYYTNINLNVRSITHPAKNKEKRKLEIPLNLIKNSEGKLEEYFRDFLEGFTSCFRLLDSLNRRLEADNANEAANNVIWQRS